MKNNKKLNLKNTFIIAGFPGIGKTVMSDIYKNTDFKVLDCDSCKFEKKIMDFPDNYISYIKKQMGKFDIILVSSNLSVRKILNELYPDFISVIPRKDRKENIINNYKFRKVNNDYVEHLETNWNSWLNEIKKSKLGNGLIELNSRDYLSNVIKPHTIELIRNLQQRSKIKNKTKSNKKQRDFRLAEAWRKVKETYDPEFIAEMEDYINNRRPKFTDEEIIEMIKNGTIPTTIRK
jgi:dephospho-CoA kinase